MKKENINSEQACRIAAAKKTSIGGQALLEGIMMRGPKMTAMAVRNTDGEIVLEKWKTKQKEVPKLFKLPLIRGVYGFVTSMTAGYKALMRSAEISGLEEIEAEMAREKEAKKKAKKEAKKNKGTAASNIEASQEEVSLESDVPSEEKAENTVIDTQDTPDTEIEAENVQPVEEAEKNEQNEEPITEGAEIKANEIKAEEKPKKKSSALSNSIMILSSLLGVVIAVGLFILLPSAIFEWLPIEKAITNEKLLDIAKAAFEGIFRIVLLVGYMAIVSLMKDIRRTFQYHGAEHKTIFCYESGLELTVENVRNQRRFHPRCGTAFLVLMLIVGMFVSLLVVDPSLLLIEYLASVELEGIIGVLVRVGLKVVLLPLTMGIGYELIKIAGKHDNIFTRIISAPGLWLQRLTVLEPTDDMIECAIVAFKEVIPDDQSDNY